MLHNDMAETPTRLLLKERYVRLNSYIHGGKMDDASSMPEWERTAQAYVDDPKNAAMFADLVERLKRTKTSSGGEEGGASRNREA